MLLIFLLLLPSTSSHSSHLYGMKTWKLVEAVTSAYHGDWDHSFRTLQSNTRKCFELPYSLKLLNIEAEGCTPGKINRVVHRWLNGNRRNGNTKVETLIDEYVIGDMLFSADTLYSQPIIQKLGLSTVSGYWDCWPSRDCYNMMVGRLERFLLDLESSQVGAESPDLSLAKESLLFRVKLQIEEYSKWYVRHLEYVNVVAYYGDDVCRMNIVDETVAEGWIQKVKTSEDKIRNFEEFFQEAEIFYTPHHLGQMLETVESLRTTIQMLQEGRLVSCFWYSYTHNLGKDPPPSLVQDLTSAISSSLQPALERYLQTLEHSMNRILTAREHPGPGVWDTENGTEFYRYRILYHTTLDLSPEYIHKIGLEEVGKVKSEIREVVRRIYESGDKSVSPAWPMQRILATLRHTDQFFYDIKNEEAIKESVRKILEIINKKMTQAFTKEIIKEGSAGLDIKTESTASMGYYVESAGSDDNGTFYIGTGGNLSKLMMRALVCHEAIPGHHYQSSLLKSHPIFSKLSNARVQYSVSTEGWSLYAEKLCGEIGVMDEGTLDLPSQYSMLYYHLGRLSMQLIRAVRLVVETGIHTQYWSYERAVSFFERNTDLRSDLIVQEIDRYVTNPGQALSYYIGLMEVLKLREEVKEKVGRSRFDIKQFHSAVLLAGSVPLPTLRSHVIGLYQGGPD